tara:strand:+ start:138 stop:386 length:249 start_codon:yes stop_codon:yes gene_type:complete
MPNIEEKSKVFGEKGVVLSFTRAPNLFLYRELIPGTKKCNLLSTYDRNLVTQSKDIYDFARLKGHSIKVCKRFYTKLDMVRE